MSTGFGRLATLDEYSPEGESWDPPPLPTYQEPPQLRAALQGMIPKAPPAPLAWGSPRVADAPSDRQVMGGLLNDLASQPPPKSFRDRVYDAYTGLNDKIAPFVPPELRPKLAAVNQAADAINPVASSARTMDALRQGKYGTAAVEGLSMIPGEGIAAGAAKLAAAGKVAAGAGAKAMGALADPNLYAPAMFIGPAGAKRLGMEGPARAKSMEKLGTPADEILDTTGWTKGATDKKWKREISDRDATFNPNAPTNTAEQVLQHPQLYTAYPDLAKARVVSLPETNAFGEATSLRGGYEDATNTFYLRAGLSPEEARKVMLHEAQHGVQKVEGFAPGGSPSNKAVRQRAEQSATDEFNAADRRLAQLREQMWNFADTHPDKGKLHQTKLYAQWKALNPEKAVEMDRAYGLIAGDGPRVSDHAFTQYRNLAGETEARNTATRADLTPDQRYLLRPYVTEDVPRADQWAPRSSGRSKQGDVMGDVVAPDTYAGRRYAPTGAPDAFDVNAKTNKRIQTVADPYRMGFPGIYANPKDIAAEANARVIAEDPAMKRLWGVSRGDLDAMAVGRVGNEGPVVPLGGPRARGALSAQNVMTPRNEQRLGDILYEGGRYPGLKHADAWYIMDPVYQRLEQMFGPAEAKQRYRHFNTMTGMASPGSDVLTEMQRGTAAHWLERQGRWDDFVKYGGIAEGNRGRGFPEDMRYIGGHPYHKTAQAGAMDRYLKTGETFNEGPKVPLYIQASGTPQTGFQTVSPVGDAHFSRGVGLTDTRKGPTDVQGSFSVSESQTLQPWWQKLSQQQGIESVPAQARLWTVLGPQTGVDSPLGQGKLELFSQQIMKAANRLGISPEKARDLIISGGAGAGMITMAVPNMGSLAAQDQYQ